MVQIYKITLNPHEKPHQVIDLSCGEKFVCHRAGERLAIAKRVLEDYFIYLSYEGKMLRKKKIGEDPQGMHELWAIDCPPDSWVKVSAIRK